MTWEQASSTSECSKTFSCSGHSDFHWVAIGAGWQAVFAYVNVVCYYACGIPLGLLLSFKLNMGVKGIWLGMLGGTVIQTLVLVWMAYKTNWNNRHQLWEKKLFTGEESMQQKCRIRSHSSVAES